MSPAASSDGESTTTTSTTEPLILPELLDGWETQPIRIDDGDVAFVFTAVVADTPNKRRQGLMGVSDLQDVDGMLFVFEEPTTATFWMQDVVLPLDIAFFDESGAWVDKFTMPLCPDGDCPSYEAAGSYKYAIEVLAGDFEIMTPGARLLLHR